MIDLDAYALLEAIGDVARLADPVQPERVTQRVFDREAAKHARYADLPRAYRLSEILKQSWRDLVALALLPAREREKTLTMRQKVEDAGWQTHEQAEFALRLVACRLGWIVTLTPSDYRREREAMLSEQGPSRELGEDALPTENQILALFGDWDSALRAAGLQPRDDAARPPATPTIVEVLDRCYTAHGTEPTLGELRTFAGANGIPFPRQQRGRAYSDYVTEWKDARRAQQLAVPDGPPPKRDRPDYSVDVGAALEGERRQEKHSPESCRLWLRWYLDERLRGERPSQRGFADWAAGKPGAPGTSAIDRHCKGLVEGLRDARRLPRGARPDGVGDAPSAVGSGGERATP